MRHISDIIAPIIENLKPETKEKKYPAYIKAMANHLGQSYSWTYRHYQRDKERKTIN